MYRVPWARGLLCQDVRREPDTASWVFRFDSSVELRVDAPWRIVAAGRTRVAGADDGQLFGLKAPVDATAGAIEALRGRRIVELSADPVTGDVTIDFGDEHRLEIFNASSGYEGWALAGASGRMVGLGGGGVAIWDG